ncbi:hypothetical protein [Haloplasma contractile]|uniref:Prepilin-type cleavage-methylation domain protein n=1 Tax=Haloplasma contractile SSD-17B TaxID=1033810 RepID=U2FM51_9MOLU|nr:hypothetical protein [Haloplasma contractile]ERJ13805.1 Prepilin-type cleavage-methylation domain protein [Haloplasma contractile SSD-17B]
MNSNKTLNNSGASLIEIVAAIAILSITSLIIINMLFSNMRRDQANQEEAVLTNVASSSINYIKSTDFQTIYDLLQAEINHNKPYYTINKDTCDELFEFNQDEINICRQVLGPTVNNQTYNEKRLNIYIFPYNNESHIDYLQNSVTEDEFPNVVDRYLADLTYNVDKVDLDTYMVRVVVVAESKKLGNNDVLLEGVMVDENFKD